MSGSAPSSSRVTTASRCPDWAARWIAVTPFAVAWPAEGAALVGVGAELDQRATESTRPLAAAQVSGVPR